MYGNRIKAERALLGITQEQLGNDMGKSQKTIVTWESEERCPTVSDLVKLCNIFSCTSDWLLGLSDSRTV